jgi:dihydroneopterin triphosphate diphosphatase
MVDILCRVIDCHVFYWKDEIPLYLLMRRSDSVIYAQSWRMIGGKIKSGEKAYETALRELHEEAGFKPIKFWAVPYINSFYEASHDRVNIIPVFAAQVDSMEVILSKEHSAFRWITYAEARQMLPWPAQLEGLRIVHEFIVAQKTVAEFVEIKL